METAKPTTSSARLDGHQPQCRMIYHIDPDRRIATAQSGNELRQPWVRQLGFGWINYQEQRPTELPFEPCPDWPQR